MTVDVDVLADALAERLTPRIAEAVRQEMGAAADDRPAYTVRTLAARLAKSERVVREMLADGVIPSYRDGGSRRVDPAAVDEYLARQRAAEGGQD